MLFHLPDPTAALAEARRILRPGGYVGLPTWGIDAAVPALDVWTEELDRAGIPAAEPLLARHALMDTPQKVVRLLTDAGFTAPTAEPVRWSDQPSPEEFFRRHISIGASGRRLAGVPDGRTRAVFLERVRMRLAELAPEDFRDNSEVLAAVAQAP